MREIPEYNGTYRCRLPFDYDYNTIYAQMELQAQLANRNAKQVPYNDSPHTSTSFTATTKSVKMQKHMPEKYDYNAIYMQFEQLAQLQSYPPRYIEHLGEHAWDIKYGRLSAEAFYNMYYAEPKEEMQACADALCTAKTDTERDALEQQIQDCQIQMENAMRFMGDYYEREGWPKSGYTPVQIKPVGHLEDIAKGRSRFFYGIITMYPQILYDGTWYSRLPTVYNYDKIYSQLMRTPDAYDINLSRNIVRNGQVAGERFFNARYLQMLKKLWKHENALVGLHKDADRNFLETQMQRKNNGMRFIQDYVERHKCFQPSNSYIEYKEYGAYLAFTSILKQLSAGTDPYDVKSLYRPRD